MKSKILPVFHSLILVLVTVVLAIADHVIPLTLWDIALTIYVRLSSINNNSFIKGMVAVPTIPTIHNPAGIVIQRPSGYWTNIRTTQEVRSIKDSSGNTYNLPNNNSVGRR